MMTMTMIMMVIGTRYGHYQGQRWDPPVREPGYYPEAKKILLLLIPFSNIDENDK